MAARGKQGTNYPGTDNTKQTCRQCLVMGALVRKDTLNKVSQFLVEINFLIAIYNSVLGFNNACYMEKRRRQGFQKAPSE